MTTHRQLASQAKKLARLLANHDLKIVFAESCTAGLCSAVMAEIPGISEYLCGSAVVYRIDTKTRWLGVSRSALKKPGPVSRQVAAAMAENVLQKTPEADVAAAITGHLGPKAPKSLDGVVYLCVACRSGEKSGKKTVVVKKHRLDVLSETSTPRQSRAGRQRSAACAMLELVCSFLETR